MESLDVRQFDDIYEGRRVLLTGHTGFKGSWLAQWLVQLGATLTGFALAPATTPSHWQLLDLPATDLRGDVRDLPALDAALAQSQPEIVFHLAAQPLVRRSYRDPLESWSTNVMGTANVLEACRRHRCVRAVVVVTTDKVYANQEWAWGYRESDRLGGHDPYSASKAAAELVAASYRQGFFSQDGAPLLATARAGNVLGGGDWSEDRLIPDLVRASSRGETLEIRSPHATRPWQHVLDCLAGYLLLGQRLLEGDHSCAAAWNFGPAAQDNRSVEAVLAQMQGHWPALAWRVSDAPQPHEAKLLYLDSSLARSRLGWQPAWNLGQALAATAAWYREQADGGAPTRRQLDAYIADAAAAGVNWVAA
ncbi:CDP-glucose 4,6-dehydratase [Cupriavidus sp. IDO]|uniref:CDP-glucose 4,6-dehydratase n=1 Tax=Cupriavidus sp. IDO TaxID=1539142 RepID=UPI00057984E0|nr:CDP-glucose 4,6-dehydratase [Cupriavidus sp. IDO]KWR79436.1 CDP-glucose 4,6-dehydratase [Cupriavidus sp. IDO]